MKQIPLLQGKALLVEMPNLKLITTIHKGLLVAGVNEKDVSSKCRRIDRGDIKGFVQLPPGNWRIIGMLSEVREKDVKPLVKYISDWGYINHGVKTQVREMLLKTALESLESSILAEGYYFSNPLGEEKEYKKSYTGHDMFFANHMVKYYEAQSRVLDRSRCLLLGRED